MNRGLIVEDQPDSQAWLEQALRSCFPGIEVASAATLKDARALLANMPSPDIALIDLGLSDGSGIELIEELNRRSPRTLSVVASIFNDDQHLFPALRAGAQGYILKDQSRENIAELLQGIASGQPPLSPAIARKILGSFRAPPSPSDENLTARETDVLQLIAKGMTMAEVAKLLNISRNTVAGYVKDIYRKLNVSSRAEAALTARNLGIVR
jgi:DNA-binding NarL/FixJ family response regulator